MKHQTKFNLVRLLIPVVSVVVVAVAMLYFSINGQLTKPVVYTNRESSMSFIYPGNLSAIDTKLDGSSSLTELFIKGRENQTGEIISVTQTLSDPNRSVVELANEYLQLDTDKTATEVKNDKLSEAMYVNYSATGEVVYYNFFQDGSRFYILRFNQKTFDNANPLIIKDNSFFNSAYLKVLSSFTTDVS